jgi:hypothetical protein
MTKLRIWKENRSFEESEKEWDAGAVEAAKKQPIKKISKMPAMPGITEETAKHLKWKSFKWMISKDSDGKIRYHFLKHPIKYAVAYIKSIFKKKSFLREGDFYLYGVGSLGHFEELLQNHENLFIIGFSYCHKPFECPSGRFTDKCIAEAENPICRQCFIGKAVNALPEKNIIPLFIPTVHYIGEKIFEIVHNNPKKKVIFLITACEMTLEMFGDWGNMIGIQGVGVRLDGRICNTMKAFELSEQGIKPGLTVVLEETQKKMLDWIRLRQRE